MSNLLYRTIAGEHPQGKPNVYFACHPADLGKYFEEYAGIILKIQDCAIWYESEPGADCDQEDLKLRLSQMQLIVIPVTTRLLTTKNRAMDTELPFAMEKHVPVLPLMMEKGLDDLFSARFGDLQYLDPNDTDETRRGFNKVLEAYIRSVLVSDETAEKIRTAFDAYIFLSYRKKDRKKAQELMRLIHKNPLCRDIAIWYDEFLTPGENFNEAIGKMLRESDLFAMVVTPNLVNETNYVMTIEYPAAVAEHKPVLPVEMEKTDRMALDAHYETLPPCIHREDEEGLREALQEKILRVALRENDNDPEHNFLIGLAYLDGIDVEVDSDRALELICGAAKAGVPEAMKQLVAMYESGKGVKRDYHAGAEWQEKYVATLRTTYEKERTEQKAIDLFRGLDDLGEAWYVLRQLDLAEVAYTENCLLAEKFVETGGNSWQRRLSISYDNLGKIAEARGKDATAQECYEKSLSIRIIVAQEAETIQSRRDLSISYNRLGRISEERGDLTGAREYHEKGLLIDGAIAKETGTVESRLDLSVSYDNLGDIAEALGNLATAQEYYEKGLSIRKEIAQETGTVESRRGLSISYSNLGGIAKARGNIATAEEYFEKALHIDEALAQETETVESRRDLCVSYGNLGDIAEIKEDLVSAQEYYEKILSIMEVLAKQTGTVRLRHDLSASYNQLGDISEARGDLTGAQEYYEKGLLINEALAKETGTVNSRRRLSVSYNNLGGIALAREDLAGAEKYYEKVLSISEALAQETETIESRRYLSVSYNNLGRIAEAREEFALAQEYYEKSMLIDETIAKETETVESRHDLCVSYNKLGDIAKVQGDLAAAQRYYEKVLSISEALAQETELISHRRELVSMCFKCGIFFYDEMEELERARDMFEYIVELGKESTDELIVQISQEAETILNNYF